METISVALATFNEEKNLGDCLKSVKGLADEIIIVDGSSTDKTAEIAKSFGAKVIITDNPMMFHINKQKAIDLATCDWVLQLDADERLTPELVEEIKDTVETAGKTNGFWIPRKNYFLGRFLMKGGQYPDYMLRLYRRGKGHLPQKSVHEQAIVEGKTGYLKNPLIHMADAQFSRYLNRFGRYTDHIAKELDEKKVGLNPVIAAKYMAFFPSWWFVSTYLRHKGFMDLWSGFVFSFFSSMRFPVSYVKYLKKKVQ
ncbi:MAG TPA: glycosyltransferase family 2 protein [Candidatus Saccharimonadales bacterium]|nr:glycosyltransferase family 2 protein [Candidatus Saccharimonadales bacterium]